MLRSVLQHNGHAGPHGMPTDGPHPDDEWLVDHLMSRRDLEPEENIGGRGGYFPPLTRHSL
eukprot:5565849-Prymnesium_polylepis.1